MKLLNENKRRKLLYKFICACKYDVYDWLTKTVKEKQLNSENRKWRWQNTHHQSNDYNPLMCFVRFLFLRSSRYKICKRRKLHEIFEINSCKKMYHTLSKSSDNCFCSIKTLFLNHLHFMWSREDILKKNKANWDTWDISPKADFFLLI